MRPLFKLYLLLVLAAMVMASCEEAVVAPPATDGKSFVQQEIGSWIIYQVDSIHYNDFTQTVDTFNYQIKEVVESEIIDAENNPALRIERYYRENDTTSWVIKDVWFANLHSFRYEKVEENVRFVRLAFPVNDLSEWDGNSTNTSDEQLYHYEDINTSFSLNNFNSDSTISVVQVDFTTLISKEYAIEIYANHVGLVYKQYIAIALDPSTSDIIAGIEYTYSIIDHGIN